MSGSTGAKQVKEPSAKRLRQALDAMAKDGTTPTASKLCENAGISRNALYRYHQDILHDLHKLQHQRYRQPSPAKRELDQLRSDNDALKLQLAQLAALVDHYFAAWQEASTILNRREKELSELRKANSSKVVAMRT